MPGGVALQEIERIKSVARFKAVVASREADQAASGEGLAVGARMRPHQR